MLKEKVRVRFAPSPTGFMHLGNARTALHNYLFARNTGGKFILRIEDTDSARSTQEAVEVIFSSLKYLGLDWDEGPFYQSERFPIYQQQARNLLLKDKVYKCYCPPEELEQKKQELALQGKPFKYPGTCLTLTDKEKCAREGSPYALRLKILPEIITFTDLIRGEISVSSIELDDFVILRSDLSPTYNFACVVDDHLMDITLVIRGEDHIPNTPKQLLLYRAFGFTPPQFAHLPMILGPDNTKLSKRHGDTSVEAYRDNGYLAEALVNALALLGASFAPNQELYLLPELIELFSLTKVSKKAAIFDLEKLNWLNREHLRRLNNEELANRLRIFNPDLPDNLPLILPLLKDRLNLLTDLNREFSYFFTPPLTYQEEGLNRWINQEIIEDLKHLSDKLLKLVNFNEQGVEDAVRDFARQKNLPAKYFIHPLRLLLTGKTVSPGLFALMTILGKEEVISRMNSFFLRPEVALLDIEKPEN